MQYLCCSGTGTLINLEITVQNAQFINFIYLIIGIAATIIGGLIYTMNIYSKIKSTIEKVEKHELIITGLTKNYTDLDKQLALAIKSIEGVPGIVRETVHGVMNQYIEK